jgi:phenylpropionate dioxygenase-like ring-hydroxylating dioxygenase large terminal subunit
MDTMMTIDPDELRGLVKPNGAHRRLYIDPAIFELEMERIFDRTWIFVAHESQIAQPGDFVRSRLGRHEVVVARNTDQRLHVLMNRCAHRGARVCLAERGNAQTFICPYHAWTYNPDGSLHSVPHRKSYPASFDFDDPANHLLRAPRVDSYRGFVFASLAATGMTLLEHLGDMTAAIDNIVDRAPDGALTMSEHRFQLEYRGNWKLHHENGNDGFHPSFVHESSVDAAREAPPEASEMDDGLTLVQLRSNSRTVEDWEETTKFSLPTGHSYGAGFYRGGVLAPQAEDPVRRKYRTALEARHGAERTAEILGLDRFNNLIYPDIILNAQYQVMRVVHPVAVNRTIITSHCFRLDGAPDEIFQRTVRYFTNLASPASMIYTDDAAIFENCQAGFEDGGKEWLDFSRGYGLDEHGPDGLVYFGPTEAPQRGQLARWLDYMTADAAP